MGTEFYTYLYLREDGTPYYVGKGCGKRAFTSKYHNVHPPKDKSRILILPRSSEQEAFDSEKELIRNWGRKDIGTGCLRNMTDGGEGPAGVARSSEYRINLGVAMKKLWQTDEFRLARKRDVGTRWRWRRALLKSLKDWDAKHEPDKN